MAAVSGGRLLPVSVIESASVSVADTETDTLLGQQSAQLAATLRDVTSLTSLLSW